MPTIEAWGLKLEPGKPHKFTLFPPDEPAALLRITNAALTDKLTDSSGRTLVKITKNKSSLQDEDDDDEGDDDEDEVSPEEFFLCSLIPGKIEQVSLNVEFNTELLQLEVIGKNEVHLLGNIIDQDLGGGADFDSEDDLSLDDEDAYRLQDVSSDVEVEDAKFDFEDDDEDDSDAERFEELADEKSLKRSADAMDEDKPAANGSTGELSKSQKKKLAKKLKNEAGEAVAVTATTKTTSETSVAAVSADGESKKSKDAGKDKAKDKKDGKKEKSKDGKKAQSGDETTATKFPNGLIVSDAKIGEGKAAKKGQTVVMRYIGKLKNGTVFDSNTKGPGFKFRLGAGEVIKGWDEGLVGMRAGGERKLTISPELAYGKTAQGKIPANSTLIFEVKMLEIK